MRNLHRCHCLQKFSKYKKTTETCRLDSNGVPSVAKGLSDAFFQLSLIVVKLFDEMSFKCRLDVA